VLRDLAPGRRAARRARGACRGGIVTRVLFVNENIGGHATVHNNLRRALATRPDIDATFYDVPAPGLGRRLVAAALPGLARLDLDLQPLRYQLAQSAVVHRAVTRLGADADVIHVYTHNAALLSSGILRGRPVVVALDGTNTQNAFRLPYRAPTRWTGLALRTVVPLERRVYDAATLVVAQSEWAAASVASYGVDRERIRVIRYGVTVPDRPAEIQPAGRPTILFVGRSLARKGGRRLLQLYRQHLSSIADLDLVTLDRVAPSPGVRVINDILPGDERLSAILRAATVFAFPSEIDQSPNAVLEAMAMGVPVVALRVGAVGEIVDDGVTGLLVDPGDDRGLVAAIESILRDPARAARMGAAARARVVERFDARVTTAALIDVLHEARRRHGLDEASASRARLSAHPRLEEPPT
jgi:starch synthase